MVQDMMTPIEDAFLLNSTDQLDNKLLVTIVEKGYTRVPVYKENRSNISMVLNVKDLVTAKFDQEYTINNLIDKLNSMRSQV
uniref:CBS domain-containing protein n=1 Tax=Heterorhabditis bacteriophora TaxID=37862 RepID=A0A1I7X5B1_HETBA